MRDVKYVRANYLRLRDACQSTGRSFEKTLAEIAAGLRPAPSYVFVDGTQYVPFDYFSLALQREEFERRILREYQRWGVPPSPDAVSEAWAGLLSGLYSVCLHHASPENIVRKNILLAAIEELLADPDPADENWIDSLRTAVDELDVLERQFSPVLDRERFRKPPTRDSHITSVRANYLNAAFGR